MPDTNISPAVSIVMPTYNRAAFIWDTIETVRNQAFTNWELIIMDDGSDDNTEALLAPVQDERIRFYKIERTGVISKVRKMGIEKASGEFIAFIDSDDLWDISKLQEQVLALQENSGAAFCLTNGYNFRQRDVPIDYFYGQKDGIKYGGLFIPFFKSALAVYLQAMMFRKQCLNTVPFKETDNDVDFIVKLAKNFPGIILYKPLLFRRLHEMNYSQTNWKKNYEKGIAVIQNYKHDVSSNVVRNAFFRLYINFGEDCLISKEHTHAARNFYQAWKNKPFSIIPFKKSGKLLLNILKDK